MNTISDIWANLEEDKALLDACILASAKSPVDLSNQVCNYIISSGGKRIRPLVLLLLARAMNYQGKQHYQMAAAVEFIHTATLLHDDVVDESDMRRKRETANHHFGNAAAVLVGDFLYSRAFQLISKELKAASIISDATNELAMGEVMQLMNVNNLALSEADYLQVIYLKTAVLFSAACQFSTVLAKREDLAENCADYGKHLGIAFQIADDLLDYVGDIAKTGKNIGDDLAERKITLPLIHALNNANPDDRQRLKNIITNGDRETINSVIEILHDNDSINYAQQIAYQHVELAKAALAPLPESKYKIMLSQLADMAAKRIQ
ncbi:MAG: octaprenyl diphosphate synthase [Gammaproteobacteria bacterium]|nr:MAG: octaprenyl diphosphate synthase [Gammaproteobacteria bacterium]